MTRCKKPYTHRCKYHHITAAGISDKLKDFLATGNFIRQQLGALFLSPLEKRLFECIAVKISANIFTLKQIYVHN